MTRIPVFLLCLMLSVPAISAVPHIHYSAALETKLAAALDAQPQDYTPRSRHLCQQQRPCFTNRLILEDSPYLKQHAHNPVNWYNWSEEALETARRENKPVFLSIGYSTCHWCHVMEKESFDDLEVAEMLNKHFIAIKVDREQRPDIDELYGYVPVITGKLSGWPTTILLKGNGDAFFGGVYYPKKELLSLLEKVRDTWQHNIKAIDAQATSIMASLRTLNRPARSKGKIDSNTINAAVKEMVSAFDVINGGFGEANKFPNESWLLFLLDVLPEMDNSNAEVLDQVLVTSLNAIANGAIHDHIGGGFHRYSVDPQWHEPHYEKMLYNQALLLRVYLKAYFAYGNEEYLQIARETADFAINNMMTENGMFWSAMDADSIDPETDKLVEGAHYIWNREDISNALTSEQWELFAAVYTTADEHANAPVIRKHMLTEHAPAMKTELGQAVSKLQGLHTSMLAMRKQRPLPVIDRKQIMSWNSMMTGSLAMLAEHTGIKRYRQAAINNADFIWSQMQNKNGFYRIHHNKRSRTHAQLEDYAWYLDTLTCLYSMDHDHKWLDRAHAVAGILETYFLDTEQGGFFHTAARNQGALGIRAKSAVDRSMPSANSIAAASLLRLSSQTGNRQYAKLAGEVMNVFSEDAKQSPSSYAGLLSASINRKKHALYETAYAARGKIIIRTEHHKLSHKRTRLNIKLAISDGWHVNSDKPLEDYLVPTDIKLSASGRNSNWRVIRNDYPAARLVQPGFSKTLLSLYEGNVVISSELEQKNSATISPVVTVHLQACNDNSCLPPESIEILARPAIK